MHPSETFLEAQNQRRVALKTLYREVAKRVHPDLTLDEADRGRRQKLMADANQAFAYGDANWLRTILEESARPRPISPTAVQDLFQAMRGVTLRARLHFRFIDRFDSDGMKVHRGQLAYDLLSNTPYPDIDQTVMGFFEEMGLFIHDGYLDEQLLWGIFGSSVVRWWAVCRDFISSERKRLRDETAFAGFQRLAGVVSERDLHAGLRKPTIADLIVFLEGERKLITI